MEAGNGVGSNTYQTKTDQLSIRCVKGISSSSSIAYGKVTDARDKKEYKTVKIGNQRWMAENLNYAGSDSIGSCYNNKAANCEKYGRLYSWTTAMDVSEDYNTKKLDAPSGQHQGICPDGWHLPTESEWNTLASFVGGEPGKKLKARNSEWGDNYGTDIYGFGALPGGKSTGKEFQNINTGGYWGTASEYNGSQSYVKSMEDGNGIGTSSYVGGGKTNQHSVRCVED